MFLPLIRMLAVGPLFAMAFNCRAEPTNDYSKEFRDCIEKAEGMTYAIQECQSNETILQESRLNTAYKHATKKLTAERSKELKEVQSLWLRYRTANCRFRVNYGASGDKLDSEYCWIDMTIFRTKDLDRISD